MNLERKSQWQPQEFGVQAHPPEAGEEAESLPEDLPAANTESCSVRLSLLHFGQATFWLDDITMDSYAALQSLQTYS